MRKIRTTSEDAECFPMYFDLQVNGYAGADFNGDQLADDQLLEACRRLRTTEWPASWPR